MYGATRCIFWKRVRVLPNVRNWESRPRCKLIPGLNPKREYTHGSSLTIFLNHWIDTPMLSELFITSLPVTRADYGRGNTWKRVFLWDNGKMGVSWILVVLLCGLYVGSYHHVTIWYYTDTGGNIHHFSRPSWYDWWLTTSFGRILFPKSRKPHHRVTYKLILIILPPNKW